MPARDRPAARSHNSLTTATSAATARIGADAELPRRGGGPTPGVATVGATAVAFASTSPSPTDRKDRTIVRRCQTGLARRRSATARTDGSSASGHAAVNADTGAVGTTSAALAAISASTLTNASACSLVTAKYSASNVVSQPCSWAMAHAVRRDAVAEQPHLQLRHAFVALERDGLGDVTAAHARQEQAERLGADQVRGDEAMARIDLRSFGRRARATSGHRSRRTPSAERTADAIRRRWRRRGTPA